MAITSKNRAYRPSCEHLECRIRLELGSTIPCQETAAIVRGLEQIGVGRSGRCSRVLSRSTSLALERPIRGFPAAFTAMAQTSPRLVCLTQRMPRPARLCREGFTVPRPARARWA